MKDQFGREIEYLRIAITQNCNLKCIYCAPGESEAGNECDTGLTADEIIRIIEAMVSLGIKKVRITGGEPLLRKDLTDIIGGISSLKGIEDLSLTTNGVTLFESAPKLKQAGLKRINISLDSLRPDRFRMMTGGGDLERVLKGIHRALESGLRPIKINTVLVKGINEDEVDDFINLTRELPVEVRFIELMPIGKFGEQNAQNIVFNRDIIASHPQLIKCKDEAPRSIAVSYRVEGYPGKMGFISPMSHQFCHCCNRIRLTCDGWLKPCLGHNGEVNLMKVLRNNPLGLPDLIRQSIFQKPAGHHFKDGYHSERTMDRIGG
jgi:cyclic pyranopterin phosphate synthase